MITRSPRDLFQAPTVDGLPIGDRYSVTLPRRLAYWAPDQELAESTIERVALACPIRSHLPPSHGPEPSLTWQLFG